MCTLDSDVRLMLHIPILEDLKLIHTINDLKYTNIHIIVRIICLVIVTQHVVICTKFL